MWMPPLRRQSSTERLPFWNRTMLTGATAMLSSGIRPVSDIPLATLLATLARLLLLDPMQLSVKRAQIVARELTEHHGIHPNRLQAQGAGALSPVASNATASGRALNRRVVFVDA